MRRLFATENKIAWVVIDFIIVIIGVYGAFWIQNRDLEQRDASEQAKILTALKFELANYRFSMDQISIGMENYHEQLAATLEENTYASFSDFRFIQPQYGFQIIEYAINVQNTDIVDFELYNALQPLFVEIKKMQYVERILTDTSARYRSIASNLDTESDEYKIIWSENYDNFARFVTAIDDRAEIAARVAATSATALPIIDQRLGDERVEEIEKEILLSNIDIAETEEQAVALASVYFPRFSAAEIRALFAESRERD